MMHAHRSVDLPKCNVPAWNGRERDRRIPDHDNIEQHEIVLPKRRVRVLADGDRRQRRIANIDAERPSANSMATSHRIDLSGST